MFSALLVALSGLGLLQRVVAFYPVLPYSRSIQPPMGEKVIHSSSLSVPIRRIPNSRHRRAGSIYTVLKGEEHDGTSTAVNQDGTDYSYFISVWIGGSSSEFNMLVDSGSSDTWVMDSKCRDEACTLHNTFDSRKSAHIQSLDTPFNVTYGTGKVVGQVVSTKIGIADFEIDDFALMLAHEVSDDFKAFPMDGILGLSKNIPTSLANSVRKLPFLDALKNKKIIQKRMFGLRLWRVSDGNPNTGVINFGFADETQYRGDIKYVKAVQDSKAGMWEIPVGDFSVNGKDLGMTGRTALMDTGTSFIILPVPDASKLHAAIKGAKIDKERSANDVERYLIPCDSGDTMTLSFGGKSFSIQPKDYMGAPSSSGSSMCVSNIIGNTAFGKDCWLIGDPFFKNVYAVFDVDNDQVGLAAVAGRDGDDDDDDGDSDDKPSGTKGGGDTSTMGPKATGSSGSGGNKNDPPGMSNNGNGEGGSSSGKDSGSASLVSFGRGPGWMCTAAGISVFITAMVFL